MFRGSGLVVVGMVALLLGCAGPSGSAPPPSAGAGTGASGGAGAAPPAAAPAVAATAGPARKVRMALAFVGTETLPVYVALDQGIYRKYGLDVETVAMQSSAQVAPAMAAGDIDIALTAGAGVVDIDLAGGDQVLILSHSDYMHFMLHAQPTIRRVEDLRDKRVAITRLGSGIHLATTIVLERAGLEAGRDTALVQAGAVDQALAALASGSVEAAMLAPPFDLFAEREGFPLLVDTKSYRIPYMQGALAVRRGVLADRYELVRDMMRAHLEGLAAAKRDSALAKRILVEQMKSDDTELLDRSYRGWLGDLSPIPYPTLDAVQAVLEQRAPEIPAARTANPAEFVDDRILRELEASGFLRQTLGAP